MKSSIILAILSAATVAAFVLTPPITEISELGVAATLPDTVGPYSGQDIFYCQSEQCLRAYHAEEINDHTTCGKCGGQLDLVALSERRALPPDTVIKKKHYTRTGYPSLTVSVVISGENARSIHRPQQCIPAQGGVIERSAMEVIPLTQGLSLQASQLLVRTRQKHSLARTETPIGHSIFTYWFVSPEHRTATTTGRLLTTIRERVLHGRNYRWAYVSISTAASSSDEKIDKERMSDFIAAIVPLLEPQTLTQTL